MNKMAQKQKILIVDDDENIAELIGLYLTKECFDTHIVNDGESAIKAVTEYAPNLVLLDIMLPGIDGYEVLREIRKDSKLPVIMLSAKGETFDKVLGLELGADDYIMKPFDSKEMVARVKAVLRRTNAPAAAEPAADSLPKECVTYPDLIINQTDYSVTYKNKRVEMPPKELELLEQLLDHIWSYDYIGDTRTVDVHIKRLREKFEEHPQWELKTVWGIGYKFEYRE